MNVDKVKDNLRAVKENRCYKAFIETMYLIFVVILTVYITLEAIIFLGFMS